MRLFLAIIFGLLIFTIGFGSLRGLVRGKAAGSKEPEPLDPAVRVLYWCENCNAEIVVVAQGNGHGFRHCGETMHRREEVLRLS